MLTLGSQERRRPRSKLSGCADAVPPGARLQRNPLAVIAVPLAPIALEGRGRYRLLIGAIWRLGPVLVEGILSHFRQFATTTTSGREEFTCPSALSATSSRRR
jgi:hypothetical protein